MSDVKGYEGRLDTFFETLQDELSSVHISSLAGRFAVERLRTRARKRADYVDNSLSAKAIDEFVAINESVRSIRIDRSDPVIKDAKHFITVVLERFTKSMYPEEIQNPLVMDFLWDNWRFGPGTSNGVLGTHTAEKISQPMTCTKLSEPFVRKLRSLNPYFVCKDAGCERGILVVNGSRLATVPKNRDTVRTIAIEPSGSMALQLAAGMYLEGALRSIGLDIRKQQPINQALALRGSISGDLATIDLKSASDMISVDLVRALFPDSWFSLLCHLRSSVIEVPGHGQKQLYMISTMGNGFTFPLMTLIIAALIYGFRAQRGGPTLFLDWSDTAVFGDDVIIPSSEYAGFVDVLGRAGLIVNLDKSFSAGPFRESCGGDFYDGVDVTPFYVRSLRQPHNIYVALNQLMSWSGKHELCLPRSTRYLLALLGGNVRLVPEWYSDFQGLRTAQCPTHFTYLSLVVPKRRLKDESFLVPLACGGYVESSGPNVMYTPRPKAVRSVVRKARLPRGYLDGHDPLTRSWSASRWISMLIEILTD
jgi:hypothetical protein